MRGAGTWLAIAVFGVGAVGCAARPSPSLLWADASGVRRLGTAEIAARVHPTAPGVRTASWGESVDATFQLLELTTPEPPHVHDSHDLTILLLRGAGTLYVADRAYPMASGDVAHIARGVEHHFHPSGSQPCVGIGIFSPVLSAPDRRLVPR